MEGEVQPKFGLMVSLILMNLSAIALFFFATPISREIPEKEIENAENIPLMQADTVLAGGAPAKFGVGDENVFVMEPCEAKKRSADEEEVVSSKKISKAETKSTRFSLDEVQTLPGKVEMRVINVSNKTNNLDTSHGPTDPPLATALKTFVGNTSSGIKIFFEGLKNGYTKKRTRESSANNVGMKKCKSTGGISGATRTIPRTVEPSCIESKANSPRNINNESREPFGADGSALNRETIPTEIVMDALSRAQTRTNDLIYVFSKKVVPAIERMNDRVTEAIRLEKNLDSYTSALINAINSVLCPNNDTKINLTDKQSRPGKNVSKKLRHITPCSELSLMRDSRIRDYVGSHSKGEKSSVNKRPVFKTLAARCWHTKHRKIVNKIKKHRRPEDRNRPRHSGQLQQERFVSEYETTQDVLEQTGHCDTKDNHESDDISRVNESNIHIPVNIDVSQSSLKFTELPRQRTVGIEEVLALTSTLEQSSDQGIHSGKDVLPYQSPMNSDPSISSGVACRSCVIERPEPENTEHERTENESNGVLLNLEQTEPPEGSAESQSLKLPEDWSGQSGPEEDSLCSEFSVVCDSRIQGYDSCLAQKEISTLVAYSPENEEGQVTGCLQMAASRSKGMNQQGVSDRSVSFPGSEKNTMELVNVFQQLSLKQKEVAMESVCLLVLRIFDAWAESQRSISSLGLSRMSLSSWPSTDEVSSRYIRPRTAICRSRIDSVEEQKSIMDSSAPKDDTLKSKPGKPARDDETVVSDPTGAQISQTLVQNIVEAAEFQIAERSLAGLRVNMLRNQQSRGDKPRSLLDSADVADQSGFGDIKDSVTVDHELAVSLMSTSRESVKVSKESSAATFYTGQPESSEDAFYECVSTMSAGTCEGREPEVTDSINSLFLERIQEEGTRVYKKERQQAVIVEPQAAGSSFSIESWLTDSGEELVTAHGTMNSEEFPTSDDSSFDVACGTDDEGYPCSSQYLSSEEFKAKNNNKDRSKKKKWATKLLNKLLKKKSKRSSLPGVTLSKNTSRSQSDSVLNSSDQNPATKEGDSTQ